MASEETHRGPAWRLAERRSAYLRGAAEQAIDWYPWGPEPFELAKRLGRPVLLDIGASWCHWCHVMDEGTYADAEVARVLRDEFVAVKVDRDESPEIDRRYQRQVGALTGEGGWPLTAFLTPDGEVFLGGTYFPPEDGLGRPGFRRLLREVAQFWKERPEAIRENTEAVRQSLARLASRAAPEVRPELLAFVRGVVTEIDGAYDPSHGGFGQAPKFPHPIAVELLFWQAFAAGDDRAGARGLETLRRMAEGGVYDQLGGGFHRYSVDEAWHIPHFEKMAADNSALLHAFCEAARRSPEPIFESTVRGILAWSVEVLGEPAGGFAASQDADNAPGDDGGYFTWSRGEFKEALDAVELRVASAYFGLGTEGRMPHDSDRNVLYRSLPIEEVAASLRMPEEAARRARDGALQKLRAVRARRPAPVVDRALYANLNGGYVRALVASARVLGDSTPLALARATADRFLSGGYAPDRGVPHSVGPDGGSGFGQLDDQVEFGLGLVELAGATLEPKYLEAARALADLVPREFAGDDGLFRDLAPGLYEGPSVGGVGDASYPLEDQPHLAANAAWDLLEIRLASLTEETGRLEKVRSHLGSVAGRIRSAGLFAASSALAAGLLEIPPVRVIVDGAGSAAESLYRTALRSYHPNGWVFRGVPPAPFSTEDERQNAPRSGGAASARACFGQRCLAPISDPARLAAAIASGGRDAAA